MEPLTERVLCRCSFNGDVSMYHQALQRWHESPQYINRRLLGVVHQFFGKVLFPKDIKSILKLIKTCSVHSSMTSEVLLNSLKNCGMKVEECDSTSQNQSLYIGVKKLLPKNSLLFSPMLEITIFDHISNETMFVGLSCEAGNFKYSLSPMHPYSFTLRNKELLLVVFHDFASDDKSVTWLQECLFPKLLRWSEESQEKSSGNIKSLSLVSLERYQELYQKLKEKYGQSMVKIWPENTDPLKFVFEDVAIATYLLLLWENQRENCNRPTWRQSFVDLGCGNGLLVYILTSEGFNGLGIDVRKRKIWDYYPQRINLKVETFDPSNYSHFPETDWIIGNHSDELTPWIPVLAARNSYKCNFFLLPCCAYEFSGQKYKRIDSSRSQYSEYLDYVRNICEVCGFKTHIDRLKIPSTKRICLVSFERNYPENCFRDKEKDILKYIECRHRETNYTAVPTDVIRLSGEEVGVNVKLRDTVERVRNCTQLPKDVICNIIQHVVNLLLKEEHRIPVVNDDGKQVLWNAGGCISLRDIVQTLPSNLLNELKQECGGLQTLLKNNHQIFSVTDGKVKFSVFKKNGSKNSTSKQRSQNKGRELKIKQKSCWFYEFHPDGCPLRNEECTFRH